MHLAASDFDADSPLRPVITFLRDAARLDPDAPLAARLARLEAILAGNAAERRAALPLIAELLGIVTDDPAIDGLPPDVLRERLLATLVQQFLLAADAMPLIFVVDDLHWLDPTSCELLERAVRAVAGHTVLLLLTTRPGFEAPWLRIATLLPLGRLPADAVSKMVQSLFGTGWRRSNSPSAIARRTDGVPLHIEAVARSLLQLPTLPELDEDQLEIADLAIPASLHEFPHGTPGPIGPGQGDRTGRGGRRAFGATRRAHGGCPFAGCRDRAGAGDAGGSGSAVS